MKSERSALEQSAGTAVIRPDGPVVAGDFTSLELAYTAGFFGIDDTGSIKIVQRYATDMAPPQLDDPSAPAYTTVEASNGAQLFVRYDVKGNVRPWDKTLYIKVVRGYLRQGDRIVVRYGDRRGGSPGIRMQTFCEPTFEFKVLVDAIATYQYVEVENSPTIAVVPGPPVRWHAVLPTLRRIAEPFKLCIKAEDRWGNPTDQAKRAILLRASAPIAGLPNRVSFTPGKFVELVDDLRVERECNVTIALLDEAGNRLAVSNPIRIAPEASLLPYWADMHGQSEETVGTNSARDYFLFARDRAFLDVAGHQGNDFQITREFWNQLNELTAEFNEPGKFVVFPGFEWSGNTALGGDRNVFYRHEGRPIFRSSHALVADRGDEESDCHTAHQLFAALAGEDVLVVPHVGGRYSDLQLAHEGKLEKSIEIHSAWGTFPWLLHDALRLGYRVGIVANSDGHKGRPGASYPGASIFGAYGGLTCMLCSDLSRDAVFDCLRRRRHYATTGARLFLDVSVPFDAGAERFDDDPRIGPTSNQPIREARMGDIVQTDQAFVSVLVEVIGSAPVERIELFNGLELLETYRPFSKSELGRRIRVVWQGAEYRGRGRQTVWDGAARLAGNAIDRVAAVNFFNPDKPLCQTGPDAISWQALTTGNFGGFDLWLQDPNAGSISINTPMVTCDVPIAAIGFEDRVFEAGGLDRRLRIFRLPDDNPHRNVRLARIFELHQERDNPIYVCITQDDGHQAWSSPIYLTRTS